MRPGHTRHAFVDLLRAGVVLLMVEAHVFNALLRDDLHPTKVFSVLTFVNGLVAPAFLFLAGFGFALGSRPDLEGATPTRGIPWRRLRRLAGLLLLGYALHLPFFSLTRTLTGASHGQLASFFQADILQTIAVSLLALLGLELLIGADAAARLWALPLAIVVVFLTPVVWRVDFSKFLPLPVATYFSPRYGSPFPLFPWAAFVFCGAFASHRFVGALRTRNERQLTATVANIFCCGFALVVLGPVFDSILVRAAPRSDLWSTTPGFFALRLGLVLLALSMLWLRISRRPGPSRAGRILQVIGQESLVVYWIHLVIIYGWVIHQPGLAQSMGPTLGFAACAAASLALVAWSCLLAYAWNWSKTRHRLLARVGTYAVLGAFLCLFIVRP